MVKVATVLENGTCSAFEVRSESFCGVHTVLKQLAPREKFTLERSSSDTYVQHWVVMGSAHVISFSSDELADYDRITIVKEGRDYKKVVNRRVLKSYSLPSRVTTYVQPEGEEGPGGYQKQNSCKPSLRESFKRLYNSTIRRGPDSPTGESDRGVTPNMHPPNRLHSI